MKVMFYIHTISHGGAERVIVNLSKQFASNGNEVLLVNSCNSEWEYTLDNRIKRIVMSDKLVDGFLKRNVFYVKTLRKIVKEEQPDVLISFLAEPNFRSVISCVGQKTKNLVSVRNDPNKEYPNAIFRLLAKTLYRFADGVVFQTEDARSWFPKQIRNKSRIIFNQVSENFFNVELPQTKNNIVTVGRLTTQKNHKMLIEAFSKICHKIDDDLIIYGDGEMKDELIDLTFGLNVSNRVHFPGTVSDVPNTIKNAKLFVLSSDYEGMPNALIEAMTLGLPCISTDCPCGGPKTLFGDDKNGILVPVADADAMAEKMLYLLSDDSKRNELAANSKAFSQKFYPDKIFGEWNDYAKSLLN